MQSKATTVDAYLTELPYDRRTAIEALRAVIRKHLPRGYQEGMQYGMIGYFVPHSVYPAGYHCDPRQPVPFAGLASQKNHMSLYLMCIYGDAEHQAWFRQAWLNTGKKLDMGKGCIRFKRLEDVPLEVVGEAIRRVPVKEFLAHYENVIKTEGKRPKPTGAKKAPATQPAAKRLADEKTGARESDVEKSVAGQAVMKKRVANAARKSTTRRSTRTSARR